METFKSKHVGCYGIVYNSAGEVLLIKKARGAYKGLLDLPGGGIDYKETASDTLKREFMEEVGIEISDFSLRDVVTNYVIWNLDDTHLEDLQHIGIIYDVNIDKSQEEMIKTGFDGEDSLGASWYSLDDISIDMLSPIAKCIYDK